ncbi:hypothetical protein NBEOAGPD_5404 [Methylobacterium gregans]|uniref:Uncharacterized protein n=1 Tax=Methylobacterium gregans TaxID=374424 RepID=A0AA37HUC2_9HYPH|nr:hypothetical protein NBEOAGPD_5404 [Methylobacterium gregans]
MGEAEREEPDRRHGHEAGGGQRREAEAEEGGARGETRQDQPDREQPVELGEGAAAEVCEPARLLAGARGRLQDGLGHRGPQAPRRPGLGGEAQPRHDPAEPGESQSGAGEAQEGGEFQLGGRQEPALRQHEVRPRILQRHHDAQEGKGGGLVAQHRGEQVAQAEQRQAAERRAGAEPEQQRRGVLAAGGAPAQVDRVRFHAASPLPAQGAG